jgi:hypothetical protein
MVSACRTLDPSATAAARRAAFEKALMGFMRYLPVACMSRWGIPGRLMDSAFQAVSIVWRRVVRPCDGQILGEG